LEEPRFWLIVVSQIVPTFRTTFIGIGCERNSCSWVKALGSGKRQNFLVSIAYALKRTIEQFIRPVKLAIEKFVSHSLAQIRGVQKTSNAR
jgi:hypothetical protein